MSLFRPEKVLRIILKLSGEILSGDKGIGFDEKTIETLVDDIITVKRYGMSLGIVLGGGNVFRGLRDGNESIDRTVGDNVGMLATVQNALIVSEYLKRRNIPSEVFSALQMNKICRNYTTETATTSMKEGKVCFFCAGTGNPYFTTDTAAVLRALELKANLVMKGTKVDGVYTADPKKDPDAKFIPSITFDEALSSRLSVMDMTAFSLARDNNLPIKVFNISVPGNILKALTEPDVGTFVHP